MFVHKKVIHVIAIDSIIIDDCLRVTICAGECGDVWTRISHNSPAVDNCSEEQK